MTATTRRRALTDEERAERRRADREYARHAVERLRSCDGWQAWLAARRHFRVYSCSNQLLIVMARPTATRVAGFRAWLALGYCVSRGETAIRIWAPCPPTRKQLERWERNRALPDDRPRTYFKLVPVFSQDQVTRLPPPAVPAPLDPPIRELHDDQLAAVLSRLDALAVEIGCTVDEEAMSGGRHGYYEITTGRIAIDSTLSVNGKVKTRCHELAHALIRRERKDGDPELDRASEELVVESVAFCCVSALGGRSDGYSIPYLASWAETADIEVLERTAGLIDRLATRIENSALTTDREDGEPARG